MSIQLSIWVVPHLNKYTSHEIVSIFIICIDSYHKSPTWIQMLYFSRRPVWPRRTWMEFLCWSAITLSFVPFRIDFQWQTMERHVSLSCGRISIQVNIKFAFHIIRLCFYNRTIQLNSWSTLFHYNLSTVCSLSSHILDENRSCIQYCRCEIWIIFDSVQHRGPSFAAGRSGGSDSRWRNEDCLWTLSERRLGLPT